MTPDDPRHGTNPGYNAGCRSECCRRAHANYQKRRQWDQMRGLPRIVPAIGVRRRVEALRALGWSGAAILREVGLSPGNLNRIVAPETMTRSLHDRFVAAYDRVVNGPVPGNTQTISSAKARAARLGYQPPSAWLNIDDPDERPDPGYVERSAKSHTDRDDLDAVLVERVLSGDWALAAFASQPERAAVVAQWKEAGRSLSQLERHTGWRADRYRRRGAA